MDMSIDSAYILQVQWLHWQYPMTSLDVTLNTPQASLRANGTLGGAELGRKSSRRIWSWRQGNDKMMQSPSRNCPWNIVNKKKRELTCDDDDDDEEEEEEDNDLIDVMSDSDFGTCVLFSSIGLFTLLRGKPSAHHGSFPLVFQHVFLGILQLTLQSARFVQ